MKFTRTDLIDRVKAEIARREQAAVDRNAKANAAREERFRQYMDRTSAAWSTFATKIRTRIRRNEPITAQDIPVELRGGWIDSGRVDVWTDRGAGEITPDVDALHNLLHLLEAATDDEVTTNSLERMGFRTAQLFRAR